VQWAIQHLLVVTAIAVSLAISLVLVIFLGLNRHYKHDATRSQVGSGMVSVVITVLFSVILSNLFAVKRDSDNRSRVLRDQHYAQLKPVLRTEADKLRDLAVNIKRQAHIDLVNSYETSREDTREMLWPDVLSSDLGHHFPSYEQSKQKLVSDIEAQDNDFRQAMIVARKRTPVDQELNAYWREVAAMSFLEFCLDRGSGVVLIVNDSGFSFGYWGASGSNSGNPPPRPQAGPSCHCSGIRSPEEGHRLACLLPGSQAARSANF
jgi:hypothetical protein